MFVVMKAQKIGSYRKRIAFSGLLALTLAGCRPREFPVYPANYREYAYVTNGASGTVTVLDVVNVRVDREIAVGQDPVAVAASPTRNEVYVVNSGAPGSQGSVSVLNAENNTVAATIPVRRQPAAIELSADGNLAYIANSGSNNISVVDLTARRETALIGVGEQPVALRLSPDGKTLVVANRQGNSVTLIDPATHAVRATFAGCPGASDAVILPDSSKTFIACSGGHQIMAVALARPAAEGQPAAAAQSAAAAQPDRVESLLDVGHAPVQLALKPDGGELFASNSLSGSISEVVTSTDDVGGAYLMGDNPVRGLVSSDNSILFVSNFQSQYVTPYAIDDGRRLDSIHVGDGPSALAFSSSGYLLFVVDTRSDDVAVVRTANVAAARTSLNSLFTLLPTGRSPNAIAVKAFKLP
jgi:YVTN family beta-propeller protein